MICGHLLSEQLRNHGALTQCAIYLHLPRWAKTKIVLLFQLNVVTMGYHANNPVLVSKIYTSTIMDNPLRCCSIFCIYLLLGILMNIPQCNYLVFPVSSGQLKHPSNCCPWDSQARVALWDVVTWLITWSVTWLTILAISDMDLQLHTNSLITDFSILHGTIFYQMSKLNINFGSYVLFSSVRLLLIKQPFNTLWWFQKLAHEKIR